MAFFRGKSEWWLKAFDFFRKWTWHYQQTFNTTDGAHVLRDIAKFCRANETTFAPTVEQTYALNGRREVWLHIQQRLHLSPETLTEMFGPDKETENG